MIEFKNWANNLIYSLILGLSAVYKLILQVHVYLVLKKIKLQLATNLTIALPKDVNTCISISKAHLFICINF